MSIRPLAIAAGLLIVTGCAAQRPVTVTATTPPPVPITVDCLGNGSICAGSLIGSQAVVTITNNTQPGYPWKAQITCAYGGDQLTSEEYPSPGPETATAQCGHGSRALYWNVITTPPVSQAPATEPEPCGGEKPGACPDPPPETITEQEPCRGEKPGICP
jgi:hypothetical protein